jgi:phosphoribosylanthranilate isomerase
MWVKICANTNLQDAALAAELGADAVGFVFAPSKRRVTPEQVAAITPHLPPDVERIGVFATQDFDEIVETVRVAGLTAVQLHGVVDEALAKRLEARFEGRVSLIQTVHWVIEPLDLPESYTAGSAGSSADEVAAEIGRVAQSGLTDRVSGAGSRILIDSKVKSASGGTGVAFDWAQASAVFASAPKSVRLIVAGGLTPENVLTAIRTVAPWGVDVASGVEASPGKKDPARLAHFLRNARG